MLFRSRFSSCAPLLSRISFSSFSAPSSSLICNSASPALVSTHFVTTKRFLYSSTSTLFNKESSDNDENGGTKQSTSALEAVAETLSKATFGTAEKTALQVLLEGCKKHAEETETDFFFRRYFGKAPRDSEPSKLLNAALRKWYREFGGFRCENEAAFSLKDLFVGIAYDKIETDLTSRRQNFNLAKSLFPLLKEFEMRWNPPKYICDLAFNQIFGFEHVILPRDHTLNDAREDFLPIDNGSALLRAEGLRLLLDYYGDTSSWPLTLGGTHGSGTTIAAFHLAQVVNRLDPSSVYLSGEPRTGDNVVIYLTRQHLAEWTDEFDAEHFAVTEKERGWANAREFDYLLDRANHILIKAIEKLVPPGNLKPDDRTNIKHYMVNIIIDDAGGIPTFAKVVTGGSLCVYFFGKDVNDRRIRIIFAGAGVEIYPRGDGAGSTPPGTRRCLLLDTQSRISISTVLRGFRGLEDHPEAYRLLRLSSDFVYPRIKLHTVLSPVELIAKQLVTNPKCAALLVQRFRVDWLGFDDVNVKNDRDRDPYYDRCAVNYGRTKAEDTRFLEFGGVYDQVLAGILPQVVRGYIKSCRLREFQKPTNLLLAGLAAKVFALPKLPDSRELAAELFPLRLETHQEKSKNNQQQQKQEENEEQELDGTSAESYSSFHALCVRGGILADKSISLKERHRFPKFVSTPDDRIAPASGRYQFFPAHVAMLHILFNLPCRPKTSNNPLKCAVTDFCLLVASCAPFYRKMYNALVKEVGAEKLASASNYVAERTRLINGGHLVSGSLYDDRLTLGEEEVIDPCLHSLKLELDFGLSEPDNMHIVSYQLNQEDFLTEIVKEKSYCESEKVTLISEYCGKVRQGNQVVIVETTDQQQKCCFADVIVLGPNKLILIRVKEGEQENQDQSIEKALANMALTKKGKSPTTGQSKLLQELINLCRCKPDTDVEVKAFVLVETKIKVEEVEDEKKNKKKKDEEEEKKETSSVQQFSGEKTAKINNQKWTAEKIFVATNTNTNPLFPAMIFPKSPVRKPLQLAVLHRETKAAKNIN